MAGLCIVRSPECHVYAGCIVQSYHVFSISCDRSTGVFADADNTLVPPEVQEAFERVRSGADFMPTQQMEVRDNVSLHELCPSCCSRRRSSLAFIQ